MIGKIIEQLLRFATRKESIQLARMIGVFLFSALSSLISSAILRIILLVIPLLIFGFILLVMSDKMLNNVFGFQAFRDE